MMAAHCRPVHLYLSLNTSVAKKSQSIIQVVRYTIPKWLVAISTLPMTFPTGKTSTSSVHQLKP